MKYLLLILVSFQTLAQTGGTGGGTHIGVSVGSAGGSWYDVPQNYQLQKYGTERLSPVGISFTGTLDSDKLGNIYFRTLSVDRKEDKTHLGKQVLFTYDSPKVLLGEKKNMDLFIKGNVTHFGQKDHFMYFKVDGEHTPTLDKNLSLEEHARVNQSQTYVSPMIGGCVDFEKEWNDFDFSGFAQASLAPVALLQYNTNMTENKMQNADMSYLNKKGTTYAFGGELVVEGMAKYKDKYYLKVRVMQNHFQGVNRDKASATNRISHYELGYLLNQNLSFNVNVENNELLFQNKDRHAIDVYNIVGVGLKYTIPKKK